MAHLHVPDGVLPWYWWAGGYAAAAAALFFAWLGLRGARGWGAFARAAFFAALMVVAMSVHIAPLGYHLGLAPLAGMVAGPAGGFLAASFANVILGLLGHGGITVIGLNALTTGGQAVVGWAAWRGLALIKPPWPRAFAASLVALVAGTALAFGIIALGTRDFGAVVARGEEGRVVDFRVGGGHCENDAYADDGGERISVGRLAALTFGLGGIGALLEAAITASVAGYLVKAAPDLLR